MKYITVLLALGVILPAFSPAAEPPAVRLIEGGQPRARIVIPSRQSGAATLLADTLFQSTGAQLAIAQEGQAAETAEVEIHIGATKYARGLGLSTEGLHDHGFVFAFPDARHVVLLSPSAVGLEFAATEFLERYVGVRWLFPGPANIRITDDRWHGDLVHGEPRCASAMMSA